MAFEFEETVKLGFGKLDDIKTSVDKLGESVHWLQSVGPANTPSAAGTQQLVIPLWPQMGRMWYIHRVVLLGADGHTAVAGALGDVYGGPAANLTADATSQFYSGLAIPSIVVEGRYHNPVQFGERVYVMLYNLPAQQQIQFAIGYEEYPAHTQLGGMDKGS